MSFSKTVWDTLSAVDVSTKIEKKMNLSYLSWAWAWGVLMRHYPESSYEFKEDESCSAGTMSVWVRVTVSDNGKALSRDMWLPVMDHKNNSVQNPTSRQISDSRMRCLVKCLAMFGLGHYIYAGEDLPDPEAVEASLASKYDKTIITISEGIESGEYSAAAEAWFELNDDEKSELWRAKSKGGVFTATERKVMQTSEFRKSYFGEDK